MLFSIFFEKKSGIQVDNQSGDSGVSNKKTELRDLGRFLTPISHLTCDGRSIDTVHRNVTWLSTLRTRSHRTCQSEHKLMCNRNAIFGGS